jgi:hypothetical protein
MPRKKINPFGADSPLVAPSKKKQAPKKKVAPKKPPVRRTRKKVDVNDLFVKEEPKKPKKRGPKSKAELEEEAIIAENKRVAARRAAQEKKRPKKPTKVYPKVTSPEDCKNILPAFKKFLKAKWKLLEEGTLGEASTVASYISGAMNVCKDKRPKEYDELYVLRAIAKQRYNERCGR